MLKIYKNLIISISIVVVSLGLLVLFALVDINIGPIRISSISTIMSEHDNITKAQNSLITEQNNYKNTLRNLDTEKTNYSTEKQKYESISDETISVIKEATKQQNYSIEYMWIKLGNYAKTNNLGIVLVEPGGTQGSTNTSTNTTTTTPATKSTSETNTNTTTTTSDTTNTTTDVPSANVDGETADETQDSENILKIQVTGSYINVSDFIFEVENDKDLKFKLDNISIEYVSGRTIKATFDVNNTIILK